MGTKSSRYFASMAAAAFLAGAMAMGSAAFAAPAPTFSGYRWPSNAHFTYDATLDASFAVDVPAAPPMLEKGTFSWNPVVTLTTGLPTAAGLPITLAFSQTPASIVEQTAQGKTETMKVTLGHPEVSGVLASNGYFSVTHAVLPSTAWSMGSDFNPFFKGILTTNLIPIMPPVPKIGWTADRAFLASSTFSLPSKLAVATQPTVAVRVTQSANQNLGAWIVPSVGHHHWTVQVTSRSPEISADLAVADGPTTIKTPLQAQLTTHSQYVLNGQEGGLLESGTTSGQFTIKTSPSLSSSPLLTLTFTHRTKLQ